MQNSVLFNSEGVEDFLFSSTTLNTSFGDFNFDEIDFVPTSEEMQSTSPSDSQSPPTSFNPIHNVPFVETIKQEEIIPELPNLDNKRKRIPKTEKESKNHNKNSAPKKIRKKHPEMQTAVTLSREKLLTTSTEDFNKWVEGLKSHRTLTQEEILDIRRQKRLIRNRESAQASRDRKKNEFSLLEKQIKQLKEEKESALKELSEMRNKMNVLETENLYMKTTIQHNPVLKEIYSGFGNNKNSITFNEKPISKTVKNAGVCLFLLIFSFGLFFNVQNAISQNQSKVYLPQNIPTAINHPSPQSTLRTMGTNARRLLSKTKTLIQNLDNPPSQLIPLVSEQQNIPVLVTSIDTPITNETLVVEEQNAQPNVHLYCMNAKEYIINPTKDPKESLIISLMLPRSTISHNSPIQNIVSNNDDLVEVTCKVLTSSKI